MPRPVRRKQRVTKHGGQRTPRRPLAKETTKRFCRALRARDGGYAWLRAHRYGAQHSAARVVDSRARAVVFKILSTATRRAHVRLSLRGRLPRGRRFGRARWRNRRRTRRSPPPGAGAAIPARRSPRDAARPPTRASPGSSARSPLAEIPASRSPRARTTAPGGERAGGKRAAAGDPPLATPARRRARRAAVRGRGRSNPALRARRVRVAIDPSASRAPERKAAFAERGPPVARIPLPLPLPLIRRRRPRRRGPLAGARDGHAGGAPDLLVDAARRLAGGARPPGPRREGSRRDGRDHERRVARRVDGLGGEAAEGVREPERETVRPSREGRRVGASGDD
jgi:hypothetical protein